MSIHTKCDVCTLNGIEAFLKIEFSKIATLATGVIDIVETSKAVFSMLSRNNHDKCGADTLNGIDKFNAFANIKVATLTTGALRLGVPTVVCVKYRGLLIRSVLGIF